jgi:hypothetical protein
MSWLVIACEFKNILITCFLFNRLEELENLAENVY